MELRLQKYQSDRRLQLLLSLTAAENDTTAAWYDIEHCRCMDILLELDDHDLHLVDQDALDLRHAAIALPEQNHIISFYVGGDQYASAALHCMRFLSSPP